MTDATPDAAAVPDAGPDATPQATTDTTSDAAPDVTPDETSTEETSTEHTSTEGTPDQTTSTPDPALESDHAVDHGPLDRAGDAIDEAKAAAGRLDQLGGTGGGDVTGDISTPGAGDDRETGQESAPEGTSDSH